MQNDVIVQLRVVCRDSNHIS